MTCKGAKWTPKIIQTIPLNRLLSLNASGYLHFAWTSARTRNEFGLLVGARPESG